MFNSSTYNKDKRLREKCNAKYEPKLIEADAIKKSEGVYELNEWFCYPTKGFAMNKHNNKQRIRINRFLKKIKERKEDDK